MRNPPLLFHFEHGAPVEGRHPRGQLDEQFGRAKERATLQDRISDAVGICGTFC
jgi:hypothetical protein